MTPDGFPASERWFQILLRLYPPDFRDEFGDAVLDSYRQRLHEALTRRGRLSVAMVWAVALADSLRNGLGERMRPAVAWRRAGDWGRDLGRVHRRLRQKPLFVVSVLATLTIGLGVFAVVSTAVDKIVALHTSGNPAALIPEVQAIVHRLDRRVPIFDVKTLDTTVAERRSQERTSAIVIAGLAMGALLLVAMGLFGLVSGSVTQRRGELALRLALGATHRRIVRSVLGDGARLVAIGVLAGVPGIYMVGKALQGLLIDVSPFDAATLAAVTIGLAAVALVACYAAARPVTSIEPERLLRDI